MPALLGDKPSSNVPPTVPAGPEQGVIEEARRRQRTRRVRVAPGFFNGPGDFKGELTATRHGNAWLVVAGGSGLAQRIEVLRHITPTIELWAARP